jgi:putative phosphoesterase
MSTIAVLSDTHDDIADWVPVCERLAELFAGADLIVHCGDITTLRVLDDLAAIAPVVATRNSGDPPAEPPRLEDGPRVVAHDGLDVGIVFALPEGADVAEVFGRPLRLVLYGGTHAGSIDERDGTLLVNPGSPTLAERTTVALVDVDGDDIRARIVDV